METVIQRAGAYHGGLFLVALCAVNMALGPSIQWPWPFLLPILVYTGIVFMVPFLRETAPRITLGKLGGLPLLFAGIIVLVSSGVLVGYHAVVNPDVTELASRLPVAILGNLVVAGAIFSVLNAILEELIFRGIFWSAILDEWNASVALVVTSLLFALIHMRGYPTGVVGAGLAGIYGLALGGLRWWTGGLGLSVASHILADVTIFSILFWPGAF